jgi:endonuclease-3
MQLSLGFDAYNPLPAVYERLSSAFGSFRETRRLAPLDQLIKSMISSRTYDEVSWPAFLRLKARFQPWESLLAASPAEIEAVLAPVTYAEVKAAWLPEALGKLKTLRGDLSFDFLAEPPVEIAMTWLQKSLPGVGGHVAAAVLNFSTLRRRAMVVDTHVWRVARRIGLAPATAEPDAVRGAIMAAAPGTWSDEDFFDLHWLLKRLGQTLCMDNRTRCGACPVAALCETRKRAERRGAGQVVALARGNKK